MVMFINTEHFTYKTAMNRYHPKLVLTSFVFVQRRFCSLSHVVKVPLSVRLMIMKGKELLIRKPALLKCQVV